MPDLPASARPGLAAALAESAPEFAHWLADPATTVAAYPAPFLRRFGIYRLVYPTPYHAVGVYLAWAPDGPAYVLTGEPANFVAAALADGVSLDTAEQAQAYVRAYLDTTGASGELVSVVDSVAAVRFYSNPDPAEQQRLAAFQTRYAGHIRPPAVERDGAAGWVVTLFVVRQQALERTVARLAPFGALDLRTEVLAGGLPVVFANR